MIKGIGCDIIEVARIEKALKKPGFAKEVFTTKEIEYSKTRGAHMAESFSARYAAKEAVGKAFGEGLNIGNLLEIEVINDIKGMPEIKLFGLMLEKAKTLGVKKIHISLSHVKEYAMAQVVLED